MFQVHGEAVNQATVLQYSSLSSYSLRVHQLIKLQFQGTEVIQATVSKYSN